MKSVTTLLISFLLLVLASCEKESEQSKPESYLDYLSDKMIVSIKIFDHTKWINSTCVCTTCNVPPHMSSIPMLNQLTRVHEEYFSYDESEVISSPIADRDGNLYVSIGNGVYKLNDINDYLLVVETGDFYFNSFAFDNDGNIWFGAFNGIAFWNKQELKIFDESNTDLPTNADHGLVADNEGTIWAAIGFEGLLKIEQNNWQFITNSEIPGLNENACLQKTLIDANNNLWFEVFNSGTASSILKYENEQWQYEFTEQGDAIELQVDSKGTIWLINKIFGEGELLNQSLQYYDGSSWIDFDVSDINDPILTVNADNEKVYIGTMNGLIEK